MSDEEDPEVVADLRLRAATERDDSRSRLTPAQLLAWKPDAPVAQWHCRHPSCASLVDVTQEAVDTLATMNGRLRSLGEREIPTDAVMLCEPHRNLMHRILEEKHGEQRVELAECVKRMRQSPAPRNEHDLIKRMTALHHPDVTGLIESLAAKLEKKPAKAKGSKL